MKSEKAIVSTVVGHERERERAALFHALPRCHIDGNNSDDDDGEDGGFLGFDETLCRGSTYG